MFSVFRTLLMRSAAMRGFHRKPLVSLAYEMNCPAERWAYETSPLLTLLLQTTYSKHETLYRALWWADVRKSHTTLPHLKSKSEALKP